MRPQDLRYERFLTEQWYAVRDGMDAVLAAQASEVGYVVRAVAALFLLVLFVQWGTGGRSGWSFIWNGAKAYAIVLLLTNPGYFAGTVRDYAWEKIPNAMVGAVNGRRSLLATHQQFDVVSAMHESLVADVRRQNQSLSIQTAVNMLNAWLGNGSAQFWLMVMAGTYMTGLKLTAIAICMGMWLIILELFERTRGFFMYWVGVMAGLLAYQLASSIYMQIALRSQQTLLRNTRAARGIGVDEMAVNLMHTGNAMFSDAMTMLALSTICALGGGAAGHAIAARAATALPGAANRMANAARSSVNQMRR